MKNATFGLSNEMELSINIHEKGDTDINIHGIPEEDFNNLVKLLNRKIRKYENTIWISTNRARDGTQITFFLARKKKEE